MAVKAVRFKKGGTRYCVVKKKGKRTVLRGCFKSKTDANARDKGKTRTAGKKKKKKTAKRRRTKRGTFASTTGRRRASRRYRRK